MKQKSEEVKSYVPEGTGEKLDQIVSLKGFKSRSRLISQLIAQYIQLIFGDKNE